MRRFPDPATVGARKSPSGRAYIPAAAEYLTALVMSAAAAGWVAPHDPAAFRQRVEIWAARCAEAFLWICIDKCMTKEIRKLKRPRSGW